MPRKDEDHAQGLAERSVNTSIVQPAPGDTPGRRPGEEPAGDRILTENQQREGMEKAAPEPSRPTDRHDL